MSTPALKLAEIADAVYRIPGVEWGFVHQLEELNDCEFAPISGADARKHRITRDTAFFVGVRHNGKFAARKKAKLREALHEVFELVGISIGLKQIKLLELHTAARDRRPDPRFQDKEREEEEKRLARELQEIITTRESLNRLEKWLNAPLQQDVGGSEDPGLKPGAKGQAPLRGAGGALEPSPLNLAP